MSSFCPETLKALKIEVLWLSATDVCSCVETHHHSSHYNPLYVNKSLEMGRVTVLVLGSVAVLVISMHKLVALIPLEMMDAFLP